MTRVRVCCGIARRNCRFGAVLSGWNPSGQTTDAAELFEAYKDGIYILHLVTGKLPLKEGLMDTTKREVPQRERRFWTTLLVFEFLLILATTRAAYARCDALRSLSD